MAELLKLLGVLFVFALILAGVWVALWKLGLLKPSGEKEGADPPYRCQERLLSEAEQKLYAALVRALPILCQRANRPEAPLLLAKVRLSDVLSPDKEKAPDRAGKEGWQAARNRIDRKHVDFILCKPTDTRPMLVIELDDKTHERADRMERDNFLDSACKAAGLPVLHIKCLSPKVPYDPSDLAAQVAAKLGL